MNVEEKTKSDVAEEEQTTNSIHWTKLHSFFISLYHSLQQSFDYFVISFPKIRRVTKFTESVWISKNKYNYLIFQR